MMPLDKYTLYKAFQDLLDQANGLPPGTTPPDQIDTDDIMKQVTRIARAITVLRWGMIGGMGLLMREGDIKLFKVNKQMPFYNFDWGSYGLMADAVELMVEFGAQPDLWTQPEVAMQIFNPRDHLGAKLSPMERVSLWKLASSMGWHKTMIARIFKHIKGLKANAPERASELIQHTLDAAARTWRIDDYYRECSQVAPGDSDGEGPEPGSDPTV